jgi:general secretion pathway protein K
VGSRGIALVMVLWVFMTLGVLALDFAQYMRDDAMAAVNVSEATSGYYLAVAGMNRAMYELMEAREEGQQTGLMGDSFFVPDNTQSDVQNVNQFQPSIPPDGNWHEGTFEDGTYSVRIVDEEGRIAINGASEATLKRVVTNILYGPDAATQGQNTEDVKQIQTIVDSILDWRDPDDLPRLNGAESDYYESLRPPYECKNGFFQFPDELLFVRGVTPELVHGTDVMPGLERVISVWGRDEGINLRSVTAPVLQVLLGVDADTANDIIQSRTDDPVNFPELVKTQIANVDPAMIPLLVDHPAKIVRIDGRGDVSRKRNQARVSAVVDLASELFDGPRVLRWLDDASMASVYDDGSGMADGAGEGSSG